MSLSDDAHAAFGRIGENISELSLRAWVEMDLGFFEVDQTVPVFYPQRDEGGKNLRDPEADIRDIVRPIGGEPDAQLDGDVVDSVCRDAFRQTDPLKIRVEGGVVSVLAQLPSENHARDILVECAREVLPHRRGEVGPCLISA